MCVGVSAVMWTMSHWCEVLVITKIYEYVYERETDGGQESIPSSSAMWSVHLTGYYCIAVFKPEDSSLTIWLKCILM